MKADLVLDGGAISFAFQLKEEILNSTPTTINEVCVCLSNYETTYLWFFGILIASD